jgi:hypothetical protein
MKLKNIFKSKTGQIIAATLVLCATACTDLNEEVRDEIFSGNAGDADAALASAYDRAGDGTFVDNGGMIAMQEYSSDIAMLPTRGSDWGDGGKWREMHEFTWTPASLIPEDNWNKVTNGITRALTAVYTITNSSSPNKDLYLAEAWGLYAFYVFHAIDLYGQSPYRYPDASVPATTAAPEAIQNAKLVVKKGPEAIDEMITLVESLLPKLSALGQPNMHTGRFTKEAAYALLADMYLNRAVYKDRYNASSSFNFLETAVSGSGTDMDKVIEYTTILIDGKDGVGGKFKLAENYFSNFDITNSGAPEHIFVVVQNVDAAHPSDNDLGYVNVERNQRPSPGNRGTNAACATTEFFHSWDNFQDDPRFSRKYQYADGTWFMNDGTDVSTPASDVVKGTSLPWFHFNRGLMSGQQYGPKLATNSTFEMVGNRIKVSKLVIEKNTSLDMNFTPEFTFTNKLESVLSSSQLNQGARIFKFEFNPAGVSGADNGVSPVDVPLYRLGGIYTMRAEAYFRKGSTALALADINLLRTSRKREALYGNAPGKAIPSIDANILYRELGFELYWEMKRRPQMVRFGTLDLPGTAKGATPPFRRIFPIPQSTMDVNKEFEQNDGYK